MIICSCNEVRVRDVQRCLQAGVCDRDKLIKCLGLDNEDCCGRCALEIEDVIAIASAA